MITKLLFYKVAQLFIIMVIGFILTRTGLMRSSDSTVLSKICLYLIMPSAILNAFDYQLTDEIKNGLVLAFLSAVVIHAVYLFLDVLYARFIRNDPVERASVMYPNAGNIIIPIVSFVLGQEWVVYTTAFIAVQFLCMWTHGIKLFSADEKINVRKMLLNINILTIFAGIIMMLCGWRIPVFAKDIISSFGDMIGPVSMLIAGMLAGNMDYKKVLSNKRLYVTIFARMIIYPLIVLFIIRGISFVAGESGTNILLVSLLAGVAPSASTIVQFAQLKNKTPDLAAAVNITTTSLCIITMPVFVALYTSF